MIEFIYIDHKDKTPLYASTNWLDQEGIVYQRQVYNSLDFMGDVAGILELFCLFFFVFINGFIEQSYNLKIIGNVYMARIKDNSIMNTQQTKHQTVHDGI